MLQAGYTGIKGTDLDILRAPALGPGGVLIAGAQPFIWESSGGHSIMNAGNLQLRRRLAGGFSGGAVVHPRAAMDNASSLGAGGPVVAQNDKDLERGMGARRASIGVSRCRAICTSSCRGARTGTG